MRTTLIVLVVLSAVVAGVKLRDRAAPIGRAKLESGKLALTEGVGKLLIDWTLVNAGDADAIVNGVGLDVGEHNFVADTDDDGAMVAKFEGSIKPRGENARGLTIPAGGEEVLKCQLNWQPGEDVRPTVLIMQARFMAMHRKDALASSPAHSFALESAPGAMEHLLGGKHVSGEFAREFAAYMSRYAGNWEPTFDELHQRLEKSGSAAK